MPGVANIACYRRAAAGHPSAWNGKTSPDNPMNQRESRSDEHNPVTLHLNAERTSLLSLLTPF